MKDNKVIQLPISEAQQRVLAAQYVNLSNTPALNQDKLRRISYLNVNSQMVMELLYETFEEMGFDCRKDQSLNDFTVISEMIKAFMARQLNIEHPLQSLLKVLIEEIEEE